jgi:hypothetical protein
MLSFQTKNPNLGKCWWALDYGLLEYFMTIWYILCSFGPFWFWYNVLLKIWQPWKKAAGRPSKAAMDESTT